jgi:hypothetical protein
MRGREEKRRERREERGERREERGRGIPLIGCTQADPPQPSMALMMRLWAAEEDTATSGRERSQNCSLNREGDQLTEGKNSSAD